MFVLRQGLILAQASLELMSVLALLIWATMPHSASWFSWVSPTPYHLGEFEFENLIETQVSRKLGEMGKGQWERGRLDQLGALKGRDTDFCTHLDLPWTSNINSASVAPSLPSRPCMPLSGCGTGRNSRSEIQNGVWGLSWQHFQERKGSKTLPIPSHPLTLHPPLPHGAAVIPQSQGLRVSGPLANVRLL